MRRRAGGYTLTEMLVVLAILSILYAISTVTYFSAYHHVKKRLVTSGAASKNEEGKLQWNMMGEKTDAYGGGTTKPPPWYPD